MSTFSLLFFLVAALGAEAVGTVTGFGATTILVPLASFVIPLKEAIVLVSVFHLFGTLWRTWAFRKGIDWKVALLFGIPSLITSAIGASLLSRAPLSLIAKLLGVLLIIYALMSLLKKRLTVPAHPVFLAGGGTIVGFLAGLVGTAGALRGAFLSSWNVRKNLYLGTGAAMGLGADVMRVAVYEQTGLLHLKPVLIVVLCSIAFFGTLLGRKIVGKLPQRLFTQVVFAGLLLAGFRFLL